MYVHKKDNLLEGWINLPGLPRIHTRVTILYSVFGSGLFNEKRHTDTIWSLFYCSLSLGLTVYFLVSDLGPVVQSIVSLTSSLRGQLVKCFTTL